MSGTLPCKVTQLCAVSAGISVLLRYRRHSVGSCMNKRLTTYKDGARLVSPYYHRATGITYIVGQLPPGARQESALGGY
jgi:hypothetical protein